METEGNDINSELTDAEDSKDSIGEVTLGSKSKEEQIETERMPSLGIPTITRQEERDTYILAGLVSI